MFCPRDDGSDSSLSYFFTGREDGQICTMLLVEDSAASTGLQRGNIPSTLRLEWIYDSFFVLKKCAPLSDGYSVFLKRFFGVNENSRTLCLQLLLKYVWVPNHNNIQWFPRHNEIINVCLILELEGTQQADI
ncbi:hypothetical protein H5410_064320 [Solanum commersonii]|uniref:Uncharacterized protein n=1 Tax=Solanum commersonii TaxID=4109 RepID=A0A9J5VZZ3_SOLCO|nr:hypothetical protein H5410_064320 [Solanum commersonii]